METETNKKEVLGKSVISKEFCIKNNGGNTITSKKKTDARRGDDQVCVTLRQEYQENMSTRKI